MKRLTYIKNIFLTAVLLGWIFWSCDDANYKELAVHAYIEEALSSTGTKLTVLSDGETSTNLNIHISNLTETDNHYKLVIDQSVLDEYNRVNGTHLLMLPIGQYLLPEDIAIKAGSYKAEAAPVTIKPFSEEMNTSGESYALALRLEAKEGSAPMMAVTGTYVIAASSIVKFSAPMFTGAVNLTSEKFKTTPETYGQYTLEVRFQVSNTNDRDRAVFKNGGDDASFILLRFEDPQSDNNEHKAHSLVQVVGRSRIYMNPAYSFEPNKWQHLALTCDGSNYRLYINGKYAGVKEIPSGPTTFSNVNWFCRGDDNRDPWRGCKILMSEARIWSVCRNETQILNNMVMTSPSSPGLEAYWRFNEGKGNIFEDCTGKGHTLKTVSDPIWIGNILSTDVSTPWN